MLTPLIFRDSCLLQMRQDFKCGKVDEIPLEI